MKPVMFFDERITLFPHTTSGTPFANSQYLDTEVPISAFCDGQRCALYEVENGDFLCRAPMVLLSSVLSARVAVLARSERAMAAILPADPSPAFD